MDFSSGFFENLWMKIVRYNTATGRYKAGNLDLSPTRSVADLAELDTIPKTIENDTLCVYVKNLPKHKSIYVFDYASATWYLVGGRVGLACNSIMWVGDQNIQGGSAGFHPFMTNRVPYYTNSPTFTNLGVFIRSFRAGPNCSTAGQGTLRFEKATKKLYWKAYLDTEGIGVDVSRGGWFKLESGTRDVGKDCVVTVKLTSEPATDAQDNITVSGSKEISSPWHTPVAMFNSKYGAPFGDNEYIYAMNALDLDQFISSAPQWEKVQTDLTVLWILDISARSSISQCDTTLSKLLTVVKKRQAVGSRVIVVAPTLFGTNGVTRTTFLPYLIRKLKVLADYNDFEVVDVNRYLADPAGTTTTPGLAGIWNLSDNTYLTVKGAHKIDKYGLAPAIQKYLPSKNKVDWDLIHYSATEPFGNLLTNGRLTGTAGTKFDGSSGRITGEVPTSFTATLSTTGGHTMTAVCKSPDSGSPIARGEGYPGNVFQVTLDNVAVDGETFTFSQSAVISSSNYAAGDTVQLLADIKLSAAGAGIHIASLAITGTGHTDWAFTSILGSNAPGDLNGDPLSLQIVSKPMILQTGIANLNFLLTVQMKAGGSAVIQIAPNLRLSKITY